MLMRRLLVLVFVVLVLAAGGAGIVAYRAWTDVRAPYKGYEGAEQFIEIPPGSGVPEITRRLQDAKVIRDARTFRAALWWSGKGRSLKAGEYRFDAPLSALDVIDRIERGDVYTRRLTFPEGLTIREMADLYESKAFGTAKAFIAAATDAAAIRDLDPDANDLEGYLFPETYAIPRGMPAAQVIAAMVARFRAVYDDALQRRAKDGGLTTRELVTLASLVETETGKAEERPLVAAVYRNRMKIGMAMQADPTVVYALEKAGRYDGNIRRADLAFDSPYNTYRYPGLPPGPIAAPGRASLEAAAAPADVKHLYFVSRNDGSHVFADTLAQHNANVYEHQILYFRKQRQRK
jgi:UPF0755 protein